MFIPFILSVRTLCQTKPLAALQGANSKVPARPRAAVKRQSFYTDSFYTYTFLPWKKAMRRYY